MTVTEAIVDWLRERWSGPIVIKGKDHKVKTADDWQKRRAHVLAGMQEAMGQLPPEKDKVPLDPIYDKEVKTEKYVRRKVTFAVEKNLRVPAWLLVPVGLKGKKAPAVLCLHQTTAVVPVPGHALAVLITVATPSEDDVATYERVIRSVAGSLRIVTA